MGEWPITLAIPDDPWEWDDETVEAREHDRQAQQYHVPMIGILLAVLVAALVYGLCVAIGLPAIVGIVAAILVLLAGVPASGRL